MRNSRKIVGRSYLKTKANISVSPKFTRVPILYSINIVPPSPWTDMQIEWTGVLTEKTLERVMREGKFDFSGGIVQQLKILNCVPFKQEEQGYKIVFADLVRQDAVSVVGEVVMKLAAAGRSCRVLPIPSVA